MQTVWNRCRSPGLAALLFVVCSILPFTGSARAEAAGRVADELIDIILERVGVP